MSFKLKQEKNIKQILMMSYEQTAAITFSEIALQMVESVGSECRICGYELHFRKVCAR